VTSMRMIMLVLFGLVGLRGAILAAEPAASPSMAAQESPASPKETGKGQQNSDGHEGAATKRGTSHDTPLPSAPPKPSKETHEGKPETTPPPAKGKGEGKSEIPKEGVKEAPGEGPKTERTGAENTIKREGDTPSSPPAKTGAALQKRPLGSNILTTKLALMGDPRLFPYDIEVEIDGGKAVLSGRVATEEDRHRAEELAQHLDLVSQVINRLEVVKDLGPAIAKRHDQTLVQLVKNRFSRSETIKAAGFDVTCERGVIHLSGTVRFQVFALEAAQAARQVPGVIAVDTSNVKLIGEENE
jgi:hyperosmotically inducible protein